MSIVKNTNLIIALTLAIDVYYRKTKISEYARPIMTNKTGYFGQI